MVRLDDPVGRCEEARAVSGAGTGRRLPLAVHEDALLLVQRDCGAGCVDPHSGGECGYDMQEVKLICGRKNVSYNYRNVPEDKRNALST